MHFYFFVLLYCPREVSTVNAGFYPERERAVNVAKQVLEALLKTWEGHLRATNPMDVVAPCRRTLGVASDLLQILGRRLPEEGQIFGKIVWSLQDGSRSSFVRATCEMICQKIKDEDVRTLVLWWFTREILAGGRMASSISRVFREFEEDVVSRCPEAQDDLPVLASRHQRPDETVTAEVGGAVRVPRGMPPVRDRLRDRRL